jgi:hypothetical protein
MARIDDYTEALGLARTGLEKKDPERIAEDRGALFEPDSEDRAILFLDFLNRKVAVTWPYLDVSFKDSDEPVPIQQQILLLHYLNAPRGLHVKGDWISFQEVPDGRFYLDAFLRRAKTPMLKSFGSRPELLLRLAEEIYGARHLDLGDVSVLVQALPMIPVALILWRGDDEFAPEGNILFDRSISEALPAEDIAWLAGMIIYPLIGMVRSS